ncbi:transcriptional regulator [Paraburkholderia dipogonis]|uniref:Transcriptional regulator n=2 Tax=Paraburkholderia dipogonis TaxID=1211383 RepID=A0A4Y8N7K6_9BURK|nr:PhaM family polyhydroxyalkanoate granule multifunctional regulatory protein [Paraburkholderia dipogonis]TFE45592.1 transcriptional regulator [Paraburkholderia dipogonis]
MTDSSNSTPPFPGFPGFPPAEMLERMWGMMRLSPFGTAFSGAQPAGGGGLGPSLSMMSDMMAPLTNVEELDKRITDMRAVEQWLKLNLSMLQSAIQALEVQRATLATLRAFGAFAQTSMSQPAAESAAPSPAPARGWPHPAAPAPAPAAAASVASSAEQPAGGEEEAPATPPFDASAWWNLLQSQFNQIAQFAMAQPPAAGAGAEPSDFAPDHAAAPAPGGEPAGGAPQTSAREADAAEAEAKRQAAKRTPAATKRTSGASASAGPKATKKSV